MTVARDEGDNNKVAIGRLCPGEGFVSQLGSSFSFLCILTFRDTALTRSENARRYLCRFSRRRRVPLDRRFGSVPLRHPDLRCNLPHPGPAVLAVSISIRSIIAQVARS